MENWETHSQSKVKITKKVFVIVCILITLISVGLIAFQAIQTKIREIEQRGYEKGVMAGLSQVSNLVINQLFQTGQLKVNLPATGGQYDIYGKEIKELILIPKQ